MDSWRDIPEFPGYAVNEKGEVASHKTGHILSVTRNQAGAPQAGLYSGGRLHRRSVALLVAETFLEPPERKNYDTPIHLNGDKSDNRVDNLMWRPRWFAVKYHQQFTKVAPPMLNCPIYVVSTNEYFHKNIDYCMKYGLLANEVFIAAHNGDRVFPTWHEVRIWDA